MRTRRTLTVWTGIILLSSMFLMGQEPTWSPSDLFYCEDADGDGYGVRPALFCPFLLKLDCDDSDPAVHPGAIEAAYGDPVCSDGLDNDCDGWIDLDDNQCQECSLPWDCEDENPCTDDNCTGYVCSYEYNTSHCDDADPCTTDDACFMGVCTGGLPPDVDQDGYAAEICGGTDCDDQNGLVNPGETEGPATDDTCSDLLDNDCDDMIDTADPGCGA